MADGSWLTREQRHHLDPKVHHAYAQYEPGLHTAPSGVPTRGYDALQSLKKGKGSSSAGSDERAAKELKTLRLAAWERWELVLLLMAKQQEYPQAPTRYTHL